ncbi:HAD family hydrolase [Candidatus Microthrix parvicella]|uniref:HAD family hydrolase n=1 Tax=Candidatus Neomicrothrix parvicella TaxID=41950 RepID=UPI00035D7C70|nr:haloacid dehalogenase-like hydrolase [Candidatus Microthrix parvicella]
MTTGQSSGKPCSKKPDVALLDFDGTLRSGIAILDFTAQLIQTFDLSSVYTKIQRSVALYQDGQLGYDQLTVDLPRLYAEALRGLAVDDVKNQADAFVASDPIAREKDSFARELTKMLGAAGLGIFVISGAPAVVLEAFSGVLRFSEYYGVEVGVDGSNYDGRLMLNPATRSAKTLLVNQLADRCVPRFGAGDSDADAPLLASSPLGIVVGMEAKISASYETLRLAEQGSWSASDRGRLERLLKLVLGGSLGR